MCAKGVIATTGCREYLVEGRGIRRMDRTSGTAQQRLIKAGKMIAWQ